MIFEKIAKLIAEQFGMEPEDITEDTTFDDLGADSVDIMELSMSLEEEFGIDELGEDDLNGIHNVGDLVNCLRTKLDV